MNLFKKWGSKYKANKIYTEADTLRREVCGFLIKDPKCYNRSVMEVIIRQLDNLCLAYQRPVIESNLEMDYRIVNRLKEVFNMLVIAQISL